MSIRISATLEARMVDGEGRIVCVSCSHPLGPTDQPWKPAATLNELPMKGAGGEVYTAGDDVLLRQFNCPSCGKVLDTETALRGDPFLSDDVDVAARSDA